MKTKYIRNLANQITFHNVHPSADPDKLRIAARDLKRKMMRDPRTQALAESAARHRRLTHHVQTCQQAQIQVGREWARRQTNPRSRHVCR